MPNVAFTPALLALRWSCSEKHIYNLINRGELRAWRLGGKLLRIDAEDAEAFKCRNIESSASEESSPSSSGQTESGSVTRLGPLTRAKLNTLRQRSTRN